MKRNILCLVGPSGSGKTTIKNALLDTGKFVAPVTCTSRKPRPGEVDGKDYHFLAESDFSTYYKYFLEYSLYNGSFYGTRDKDLEDALATGKKVVLVMDINGVQKVKERYGDRVILGYVQRNKEAAIRSILSRNVDQDEITRRLASWEEESQNIRVCDVVLQNNGSLSNTVRFVKSLFQED